MRILVTGATGLLGTELCRRLSGSHVLTGWARRLPGPAAGAKLESVDVTDAPAVQRGLERLRPDLVIHAAAMTDVDACERDPSAARRMNAEATGTLAAACSTAGAVLLAVSTDYVFDGETERPYRETDAPRPVSAYGASKLKGERLALERASRVMVLRVSGLFGPARQNFVRATADRFRAGKTVPAVADQLISPSYTVDLAEGIARLIAPLERSPEAAEEGGPLHGLFHLANRGCASRVRVAEEIARIVGKPASLIRKTSWADLGRPARRPARSCLDSSRFSKQVGEGLRAWEEAIQAFLSN
jgi:dTDP-4-dehydrorhamnose reductase